MRRDARLGRIGLTVLTALLVVAAVVLLVGEQNFLFTKTNKYFVLFPTVAGLAEGNPVQLSGVVVGKIDDIILPENIDTELLQVWVSVERRYASRVRQDSVARIKSLGLLGDKYVDITSGSPGFAEVEAGQQIPAAAPTDVDKLIASGGDVLDNIVIAASSLSNILTRMEDGEGLLGELITEREGERVTESLVSTLESVDAVVGRIESGEGTVGRLFSDQQLADDLSNTVATLKSVADRVETGEGILGTLLDDKDASASLAQSLENFDSAMADLSVLAEEMRSGDGLLPKLIHDDEYGQAITDEIQSLLERLDDLSAKVSEGDGTAARLINDPAVFEALNDVVIGINESRLLRWMIRNRQKKGIKKRYADAVKAGEIEPIPKDIEADGL